MNMTREQIAARRAELDAEQAALDAEEERLLSLPDDARLAEELHTLLCRWNHTDGCGWYYETDKSYPTKTWQGYAHEHYLSKAQNVMRALPNMPVDEIVAVVEAIQS